MAITAIKLDQSTFDDGQLGERELPLTPPLVMRELGKTVVLAGTNGAGKSRLLRLLEKLAPMHMSSATKSQNAAHLRQMRRDLESCEKSAKELRPKVEVDGHTDLAAHDQLRSLTESIKSLQLQIKQVEQQRAVGTVFTCDIDQVPRIVSFVPRESRLGDPSTEADASAIDRSRQFTKLGSLHSHLNAPAYARAVLRAAISGHAKRAQSNSSTVSPQETSANELKALASVMLGTEITLDLDDTLNLTFEGRRSYADALSAGQQILFQFACLLHAQGPSIEQCVVLMDEPENHLHPSVLAEVIDGVRRCLKDGGQLWVATHSVPLIAHLVRDEPDCLWYAEAGRVKHAGRSPEKVLESLMGGAEGARNLHEFTLLPAQYAALRFMSECLVEPGVVGPGVKDPQTNQIAAILRKRRAEKGKPLRVLDYGAGKARLLATLAALDPESKTGLDYLAFDLDSKHEPERQAEILAIYGPASAQRSFTNLHSLATEIDAGSVDVVVMCNVLHEVDPSDWLMLFGSEGLLSKLLAPEGALLVVEDYGIPVGESAHPYGFLLLETPELRKLFGVKEADTTTGRFIVVPSSEEKYKDRLIAHLVHTSCVERVTFTLQRDAISFLKGRMTSGVKAMLSTKENRTGAQGRNYARMAQLLTNAMLWEQDHPKT